MAIRFSLPRGAPAEAFSKAFTPHDTSVHLGMAATLHLIASVPNACGPQECTPPPAQDKEDGSGVPADPFRLDADGCLPVPQRPALGVAPNPERLRRHSRADQLTADG